MPTGCSPTASSTTTASPSPTSRDPLVRQEIAAIETGYRIGRLMVLREVMGQAPKQFSAATKTFCTELEQRIASFCASVLGPDALLAEPGLTGRVSRNVCYAPAYTIMGGTSADPAEHHRGPHARPAPIALVTRAG